MKSRFRPGGYGGTTAGAGYIIGSPWVISAHRQHNRGRWRHNNCLGSRGIYNKEGVFDGGNQAVKGNVTIATAGSR